MSDCKKSVKLHSRINRIIGQLKAIDRMIENDEPCDQVMIQLNAVKSAVHNVGKEVFKNHAKHCIADNLREGEIEKGIDDFEKMVDQFSKLS